MAAPSILTQGATITITDNAASPVAINGHQAMTGMGSGEATIIDVTTLASTAKEKRMGLQDWGSFELKFIWNLDDDGQAAMLDAKDTQAQRIFVLTLPSSNPSVTLNVWTANVYILKMQFDVAADSVVLGTATIAVTGDPVWS